jgi:phosphoribosylformylglycinamidine synthase
LKAIVRVDLKPGVLDPQGKAVAHALQGLGFDEVTDARQGKVIELDLTGVEKKDAEARVKAMCEALLANTVIERYRVELAD